jgi:hypothetical protein
LICSLISISSWMQFRFVTVLPKYWNFATFWHDLSTISTRFPLPRSFRRIREILRLCETFLTSYFLRWGAFSFSPNPPAGRSPLVGCPRLLIQHIRRYPPHILQI